MMTSKIFFANEMISSFFVSLCVCVCVLKSNDDAQSKCACVYDLFQKRIFFFFYLYDDLLTCSMKFTQTFSVVYQRVRSY